MTHPDGKHNLAVGLDAGILASPRVWEASGHVAGFNDMLEGKNIRGVVIHEH